MSLLKSEVFDSSTPWCLSAHVSLRDEAFGALAYHHRTRRLVFLKSRRLVALVRSLEEFESVDLAIDAIVAPSDHDRYVKALASLATSEILCER